MSGVAVLPWPSAGPVDDAAAAAVPVPVLLRGLGPGAPVAEALRGRRFAGAGAASAGSEAALPVSLS